MKSFSKTMIVFLVIVAFVFAMVGCNGEKKEIGSSSSTEAATTQTEAKKEPVKLKYATFMTGTHVAAPLENRLLAEFKEKYKGEIELEIEELPSDQVYVEKIKLLIASGDLPDVIDGKSGNYDLVLKAGLAVDLTPYLDADPVWKTDIGQDYLDFAKRIGNGKVYTLDGSSLLAGYFYNKDMFSKAGIKPAETWDEWFSNCEKLKAAGFAPLALMTGEAAWTTNLILAAYVATSGEAGNSFMKARNNKNYETPEFIDGLSKIQIMLQKYTTSDALGAAYGNAANNFLQGKAAIISNGSWMIPDFTNKEKTLPEFDKIVGSAIFPNGGAMKEFAQKWMICSKDKEHADAAAQLIKFYTDDYGQMVHLEMLNKFPTSPKVKITDEFLQKNPIFAELFNATKNIRYTYPYMDSVIYANVRESFQRLYPELIANKITPEEMAKKMTELASKNE